MHRDQAGLALSRACHATIIYKKLEEEEKKKNTTEKEIPFQGFQEHFKPSIQKSSLWTTFYCFALTVSM